MSFVATPGKLEQFPLAVMWLDQPPTLQLQAARVIDAQSWTALFRVPVEVILTSQEATTKDIKFVRF